jgi:hydroxymethylglutaryl-CoA lyase
MQLPERVTITEVGPRDGLQNEELLVDVDRKLEMIDRLAAAGLHRIEAASFVSPKAIPQMRDAAEVMTRLRRLPGVTYIALVPNETGARNAIAAGADELSTVVSASETHNLRNINRGVEETLAGIETIARLADEAGKPWCGYISTAFGCPYEGAVAPARVVEIAAQLRGLGSYAIAGSQYRSKLKYQRAWNQPSAVS